MCLYTFLYAQSSYLYRLLCTSVSEQFCLASIPSPWGGIDIFHLHFPDYKGSMNSTIKSVPVAQLHIDTEIQREKQHDKTTGLMRIHMHSKYKNVMQHEISISLTLLDFCME